MACSVPCFELPSIFAFYLPCTPYSNEDIRLVLRSIIHSHQLMIFTSGVLYIEVDTPTYERLGLVGRPIRDGGKRHKKNRYGMRHTPLCKV
jgi:hypothetical protein